MESELLKTLKLNLPEYFVSYFRKVRISFKGEIYKDLTKLAKIHKSDKWDKHFYTPHYQKHFRRYRNRKIKILEIGVGGNKSPSFGGASLRMWKDYFRKGNVYGIDLYDKTALEEKRIAIFQGSQDNEEFLKGVISKTGELDIIRDDGSHMNDHIIKSFEVLFPYLRDGGIYVVEDLQTSYWEFFGGSSEKLDLSGTAMNYFKKLTDGINFKEFLLKDYKPTYFDENITSVHFYHSIVFIYKGKNSEPSSYLTENQIPRN